MFFTVNGGKTLNDFAAVAHLYFSFSGSDFRRFRIVSWARE
jgi:hypothetical protein